MHRLEFTESENPWAPTAAVAEINADTGSGLELVGLAEQIGGISSAAFVRWPDGRECALTRSDLPIDRMRQTAEVLSALRSRGLPLPRHDLVVMLADGLLAVVQERLPGRSPHRMTAEVVDTMVAANEWFAGLLADRPDVPARRLHLRRETPTDAYRHDVLAGYGPSGRRLLDRIREIGATEPYEMRGDDLVHPDFNPGNVLLDDAGRVTGIVDWNGGVSRGDRRFALLRIVINLDAEGDPSWVEPEATERLDEIIRRRIEPDLLRAYWAAAMVERAYEAIRKGFPPERIEDTIRFAERHLV